MPDYTAYEELLRHLRRLFRFDRDEGEDGFDPLLTQLDMEVVARGLGAILCQTRNPTAM